ncbi:hypothetical protein SPIROBIBN47_320007 [uncultured spirochete]|jgi:hypothetical protein|uniref:Uncharacterized protein n=1 Tax=uncultured spirochete TaxID=156406 RepID=A0A3P3XK26_9SPIR|nr:hypothetical protein SPIROBIBN47_320007 [uncultured spirochete]
MKNPQEKMKSIPGSVASPDPLQNLLNVYLKLIPSEFTKLIPSVDPRVYRGSVCFS